MENISKIIEICNKIHLGDIKDLDNYMMNKFGETYKRGITLSNLIKRPSVKLNEVINFFDDLKNLSLNENEIEEAEILIKYEGYIKKQEQEAEKLKKLDNIEIPKDIDYLNLDGLALEARSKLDKIRPISIGQASRISGINPSDITILNLYIQKNKKY